MAPSVELNRETAGTKQLQQASMGDDGPSQVDRLSKRLTETFEAYEDDIDSLESCDAEVGKLFENAKELLRGELVVVTGTVEGLARLVRLSHERMTKVHHAAVEKRWRRLFTDATLLRCLLILKELEDGVAREGDRDLTVQAIKDADLAIILAGAPGMARLELLHEVIAALQSHVRQGVAEVAQASDNRVFHLQDDSLIRCRAGADIRCLPQLPNLVEFLSDEMHTPFIVRGGALHWPTFEGGDGARSKWCEARYLRSCAGVGRVVPVEIGKSYEEADWSQELMLFDDFLERCGWDMDADGKDSREIHYLAQFNLFDQFPQLRSDIIPLDIVYAAPPPPMSFPGYSPPVDDQNGAQTTLLNAWMGPKNALTPVHRDPYFNCFVQVVGYKQVWIGEYDLPLDGLQGHSTIFSERAMPLDDLVAQRAHSSLLSPGDVLYMPPGWPHSLRSATNSFSVSMWF